MNFRYVHIATLVFATMALVLGTCLSMEDAENWGQLQWAFSTLFNATLGACMFHAIINLAKK